MQESFLYNSNQHLSMGPDTKVLPRPEPISDPTTDTRLIKPKPGPIVGIGAAGVTIADLVQEPLAGIVFIYSSESAAELRKKLCWETPSRTFKYRDVNWTDFAKEFELCARTQNIDFDDHNIFTSYALYMFQPEYNPHVNQILSVLNKRYPA